MFCQTLTIQGCGSQLLVQVRISWGALKNQSDVWAVPQTNYVNSWGWVSAQIIFKNSLILMCRKNICPAHNFRISSLCHIQSIALGPVALWVRYCVCEDSPLRGVALSLAKMIRLILFL